MKFDELNRKMRVCEAAHHQCVLPGIHMVARLDGRGFTWVTKETHKFEVPYGSQFRHYMVGSVKHLMDCGFRIIYAYPQSDERQ
jgi:tRNA(His) 5'-end guanylyltransferase